MLKKTGIWEKAAENRKLNRLTVNRLGDGAVQIAVDMSLLEGQATYTCTYTVYGNGEIVVSAKMDALKGEWFLPRFGMSLGMPDEYGQYAWYGRGPHENHSDRKDLAPVGLYQTTVEDGFFHYIRPQESNNKTEVRWLTLTNEKGRGLMVVGKPLLSASAWPYTQADLATAEHTPELPERDFITVNLDWKQMGVGGDDSWSVRGWPHEPYLMKPGSYHYEFRLVPVRNASEVQEKLAYRLPVY